MPLADPLGVIATLDFQININVYGLIHMAQAFTPVLKAQGGESLCSAQFCRFDEDFKCKLFEE